MTKTEKLKEEILLPFNKKDVARELFNKIIDECFKDDKFEGELVINFSISNGYYRICCSIPEKDNENKKLDALLKGVSLCLEHNYSVKYEREDGKRIIKLFRGDVLEEEVCVLEPEAEFWLDTGETGKNGKRKYRKINNK